MAGSAGGGRWRRGCARGAKLPGHRHLPEQLRGSATPRIRSGRRVDRAPLTQAALQWLAAQPAVHFLAPRPRARLHNFLATGICQSGGAGAGDLSAGTTGGGNATHPLWMAGLKVKARAKMRTAHTVRAVWEPIMGKWWDASLTKRV